MRTTIKLAIATLALSTAFAIGCEEKKDAPEPEATETKEQASESAEAKKDDAGAAKKDDAEAKKDEEKKDDGAAATAKVGEPAPDFTLTDQDGKEHKLSDYKGKIVVLEWTNETCPYVVRHYKAKTMSETFKAGGEDVVWLAVNSTKDAKAEDVKKWRGEQGFDYPVLMDADGKVGKTYGAKTTPHMYVVDAEGKLRYSGAIDDDPRGEKKEGVTNYVSAAVKALKEGKDVETSETKPYGCSVKYGS